MNIITSTHYNRPACTSKMIDYLSRCEGIDDYLVCFFVEPGCKDVLNIINECGLKKEVVVNDTLKGCWSNKKQAVEYGFSRADYVIHVEDDILLSQDALKYFEWCRKTYINAEDIFSVTAFHRFNREQFFNTKCQCCGVPTSYYEIERRRSYSPWGWATWKNRWEEFQNDWNGHDAELELKFRGNRFEVFPTLSRCQNIGYIQGVCGHENLLDTVLSLGHEPVGMSRNRVEGKLVWRNPQGYQNEPVVNEMGREWIKLDDTHVKSRYTEEQYRTRHYVEIWAGEIEMPSFNGFFDLGRCRPSVLD